MKIDPTLTATIREMRTQLVVLRFTVVSAVDIPYGYRLENGSYHGIMGLFERGVSFLRLHASLADSKNILFFSVQQLTAIEQQFRRKSTCS